MGEERRGKGEKERRKKGGRKRKSGEIYNDQGSTFVNSLMNFLLRIVPTFSFYF